MFYMAYISYIDRTDTMNCITYARSVVVVLPLLITNTTSTSTTTTISKLGCIGKHEVTGLSQLYLQISET